MKTRVLEQGVKTLLFSGSMLCMLAMVPSPAPAGVPELALPLVRPMAAMQKKKAPLPTVTREQLVTINVGPLSGRLKAQADASGGKRFHLDLFGRSVTVNFSKNESVFPGSLSWIGTVEEFPGSEVILVINGDVVQANIVFAGKRYHIRYVGHDLGQAVHALQEINPGNFPPEHPPGYEIGGIVVEEDQAADAPLAPPVQFDPPPGDGTGSIIDVMVLYTPAARDAVGGTTAMNSKIDLAITETNQGYANSGIHQRMNLVYRGEIDYDSNTTNPFNDALSRLQNPWDGYMDIAHTWRDTYKADLVSLWIDNGSYCGLGYLGPYSAYGFQVCRQDCATGYYSFAHEFGHNQGARHDWARDDTSGYMHGYVDATHGWRTIMAYNRSDCPGGYCQRLNYWSNPDNTYNGAPMGVAIGQPEEADNHQWMNDKAYEVTNFRFQHTTYALPSNQWHQIAIPYQLPADANTVEQVFGDDLGAGSLGTTWVMYRFDPNDNQYHSLGPASILEQGVGYWILQWTGSDVTLSLPAGISASSPTTSNECSASSGCVETGLATRSDALQWQMLGNHYPQDKALASLIIRDASACSAGCTYDDAANTYGLVAPVCWHYNPESGHYEALGLTAPASLYLQSWYGYWLATRPAAYGYAPTLLNPSN